MDKIKQIIVIRKDLNMRKGKIAVQASHASLGVFTDMMSWELGSDNTRTYSFTAKPEIFDWLDNEFTKICVSVDSKEELLEVYKKAEDAGLLTSLIVDAGHTEFNGRPTLTCCAIGPAKSSVLQNITGNLKLL